ncbi:MAG TPA: FAD-binding oxidoreductase [Polyangiaceae bacterium]|nr:FAD-binding oxidoreductase [Polyangiaceae bacterium]HMR78169.1 FAD-binding oxidoreductase [Polyangiaceae bacterium]
MGSNPRLKAACNAWAEIVGAEHVVVDAAVLERVSTATFATEARVAAVVRPASTEQVRAVLAVANQQRVTVYPTSQGKNWGLGSKVPTSDGAVLLDLGRMRGISEFDDALGCVRVEAGVTFHELYAFLVEHASTCFLNVTGSSPDASVLANAIERGDGAGPNGYRFGHVSDLEVVLPDGELLHTGFRRFGPNAVNGLHRYGVGPALDGLFSQSNLGVVTRLTLWLAPIARALGVARFRLTDKKRLPALVDALRVLRREGTLRANVALANDLRVLSTLQQFPFREAQNQRPLSAALAAQMGEALGGAKWFGLTAVYAASEGQCAANLARVRQLLAPVVDELEVQHSSGDPKSGQELFPADDPALRFLQGIPHEGSLRSLYWRKKAPAPAQLDPEGDRCGVLWLCPTLPFRGNDAAVAAGIVEDICPEFGFEPLTVLLAPTERMLFLVPLIIFDRDDPGDDERALFCHDALLAKLNAHGYLPHRLGIQSMRGVPKSVDSFDATIARLKQLLDPNGILAPGRYDFGARQQ